MIFFSIGFLYIPSVVHGENISITINQAFSLGKMPYIYRSGIGWWFPAESQYIFDKFFSEHKAGAIRISLGPTVISKSKSLEHLRQLLSREDKLALAAIKDGGEVNILINAMPFWLASNKSRNSIMPQFGYGPEWQVSPPYDYNEWAKVVYVIADHFSNKLGIKARYLIWNEPDWQWKGTQEEYLKLYKYSVLGIRKASASAQIGGPTVGHWNACLKGHSNSPLIYNLIEYASKTSLPQLHLKRLPIDFISWNQYFADPLSSYKNATSTVKKWLDKFGYSNVRFILGEWNYGSEPLIYGNPVNDNFVGAAYIATSLYGMDTSGIHRATFQGIQDSIVYQQSIPEAQKARIPDGEFFGYTGIFTKHGIIKASYNSFKMISMLGKERIKAVWKDPFLTAVASRNADKITVLISNFIPKNEMMKSRLGSLLTDRGLGKEAIKFVEKQAGQIVRTPTIIDKFDLPIHEKRAIKEAYHLFKHGKQREKEAIHLTVRFSQLAYKSKYDCKTYLIDSKHSNSYNKRKSLEAEIKKTIENALKESVHFLRKGGFSEENISKLKQAYNKGSEFRKIVRGLSSDKKQYIKKMYKVFDRIIRRKVEVLNENFAIKLNPTNKEIFSKGGQYEHDLVLEANGVCLLTLSAARKR